MSTQTIRVPISGNDRYSRGWVANVSQYLDAGTDVEFVNDADTTEKVEVSRINLASDGLVSVYGRAAGAAAAVTVYLSAGGFHNVGGIHGIKSSGTAAGANIRVKI